MADIVYRKPDWEVLLRELPQALGYLRQMEDGFAQEAAILLHAGLGVLHQKHAMRAYDFIAEAIEDLAERALERGPLPHDLEDLFLSVQAEASCWAHHRNVLDDETLPAWLTERTKTAYWDEKDCKVKYRQAA